MPSNTASSQSILDQVLFSDDAALAERLCTRLVESEQFHTLHSSSIRLPPTLAATATQFLELNHSTGAQSWGPQLSALDKTLCSSIQSPLLAGVLLKLLQMARIYCTAQSTPLTQMRVHIPNTLRVLDNTYKAMECSALMSPDVIDRLTADLNAVTAQ